MPKPNSKKARRQANFCPTNRGPNGRNCNTVRRTAQRGMRDLNGHRPPVGGKNDDGRQWLGFSRENPRKPFRTEPNWRAWVRYDGLRRWRIRRAIATADAALAELDMELPGMWDQSDLTGGWTDVAA